MFRPARPSPPAVARTPFRPQRVLMTADTVGGVWTYALDLCRGLERAGISVVLATMGPPPRPAQRAAAARLRRLVLVESTYRLEWMEDPWADVCAAGGWLLSLAKRHRVDLVHLNGFAHAALPWDVPVLVAAHSCALSWWEAVKNEPAPSSWRHYAATVGRGLRAADLVVAPTQAHLTATRRLHGPLRSSRVIPNGRDAAMFVPSAKHDFILGVGRLWDAAKNAAALVQIAPDLPWPVRLAGDTGTIGRVAIPANVSYLGACACATLARHYADAAVFAEPAFYEPFGLAALEAGLAGCALVLGDIPSLREVWRDAAYYVPPDRPEMLRSMLLGLIQDPARRATMGARARARARQFTVERMTAGYLRAYRDLLAPARRSPGDPLPR
ncbi:MAG TPA: glycosyltransferase family 4 protein [Opitutus sp.]|nr:glycosyltransferase family 4 protein [Opitutus sp.]